MKIFISPSMRNSFLCLYEMQKGAQQICVEHPGVHELYFANSCISFGSSSIKIDTLSPRVQCLCWIFHLNFILVGDVLSKTSLPTHIMICFFWQPIYLKAEKYLLKGQIKVVPSSSDGVSELPENLIVDILNSEGNPVYSTESRLTSSGNGQTSGALYEYSTWASLGEKLVFVPRDPRYILFDSYMP